MQYVLKLEEGDAFVLAAKKRKGGPKGSEYIISVGGQPAMPMFSEIYKSFCSFCEGVSSFKRALGPVWHRPRLVEAVDLFA